MLTFNSLGRYGRLGNQMFQIASTIGIAMDNYYEYGFPLWLNYDHVERFGSSEDVKIYKYFVNELPMSAPAKDDYFVHWGYHKIKPPDGVSLSGHMQSERYFKRYEGEIRHYFKMRKISTFKPRSGSTALHIRLGDYDGAYHTRLGLDYYGEAANKLGMFNKLYIFSDEPAKAKELFGRGPTYIEGNHYMEDFYIMSLCDNFIIGNSTYSWWAAWLADVPGRCVVAPRAWFGPKAGLSAEDIYCEGWNVI